MRDQELELLRIRLQEIKEMGWIKNRRPGNAGDRFKFCVNSKN